MRRCPHPGFYSAIAITNRELLRFSKENMLWRKLCKRQGWNVPYSIMVEAPKSFDFKQYYAEKHTLSQEGSLKWTDRAKTQGTAPSKRFKHTSTVVGKHLVYIGGQETDTKRFNDIVYYDTETKTFSQPAVRGDKVPNFSRHSASLVGNRIFTFGGLMDTGPISSYQFSTRMHACGPTFPALSYEAPSLFPAQTTRPLL